MESDGRQKVIVAGAGVAGIEVALALRDLAGERVAVELFDPRREFVYRPFAVAEPYGSSRSFRYDLARLAARCGAAYRPAGIVSIDPARQLAVTRDGQSISYDSFVLACGVRMLWAVPGSTTFWGVADEGPVTEVIGELRTGGLRRPAFTSPASHGWALPLYELALLAAAEVEKAGSSARIVVVSPEEAPLSVFGLQVAEGVGALLAERNIEFVGGAHPIEFGGGRLRVAPGEAVEADAAISLPRLEGRRVAGVPHDANGLVAVDEHCGVIGLEGVYAAGDVTAFPVKQGGIAGRQADVVAEAIAAEVGGSSAPRPFEPILHGVLWTGVGARRLYGRPSGGHGEVSAIGEEVRGLRRGKITTRYFSPLVEELEAEAVGGSGDDPSANAAPARPVG